MAKIQRVLISVTDKTGVSDFARGLVATRRRTDLDRRHSPTSARSRHPRARRLAKSPAFPKCSTAASRPCIRRSRAPSSPSAAIRTHAARSTSTASQPIDMVVVNLYQFEKVAAQRRCAARRADREHRYRRPHHDPLRRQELPGCRDRGVARRLRRRSSTETARNRRRALARNEMAAGANRPSAPPPITIGRSARAWRRWTLRRSRCPTRARYPRAATAWTLRYGENPHQQAALYGTRGAGIAGAEQLHGKELSYNNLVDLDAALAAGLRILRVPRRPSSSTPIPAAAPSRTSLAEAYRKALECDPVSAFGGVIGFNRAVDEETAREVAKLSWKRSPRRPIQPRRSTILEAKKNLRLVSVARVRRSAGREVASRGGYLAQTADRATFDRADRRSQDAAARRRTRNGRRSNSPGKWSST